ncbi:molybdate transporter family protein [Desulfohalovibrio reitneri]|uniref:molybdate transporter family protein n=1 Tax=Desulfohalovibrio reitneri TaxID=1307759 RepID=UPI0004A78422|nr:molybdate transporter family protein [Desulfohalovibrio reitneri]
MTARYAFNRMELSGSLGDLGTLLPIAVAMILVNNLSATGIFLGIGLFYIVSGVYFGLTVPVQPMKVVGAYAIATAMAPQEILASSLLMSLFLLAVSLSGGIDVIRKLTPRAVIRGIQLSTGVLLMAGGVRFMLGTSKYQELRGAAEPFLNAPDLGPIPFGVLLGVLGGIVTLALLENRRLPAGLAVVVLGLLCGLLFGAGGGLAAISPGFHMPKIMPFGLPAGTDFTFALFALVLPQLPMTLGNASIAYTDLSREYFPEKSGRVTNKRVCVSMALANIGAFLLGGFPMCHGAGGLAAHYRFGARTAGSNLMIGGAFVLLALLLGEDIVAVLNLLPMAVLGVLLLFAGSQLALTILDLRQRKDLFVALLILGITLAANLAWGFVVGIALAWALKWKKLSV